MKKWKRRYKDAEAQCERLESLLRFVAKQKALFAESLTEKDEQLKEAMALSARTLAENALLKEQLQNVKDELSSERVRNAEHLDILGAEIVKLKHEVAMLSSEKGNK